ncbi:thioredoxin family protein [Tenuifilum thalassicum]|uniref:Thioredoxin family protein n=1 Tax=Tenuifilum thalassicum TaxID=2590900 RepID=A0A7D4BAK1_9BACT|nr:thioredoxin family protein [Tenuifilum thalassicum]QKG79440.1 thioredoxin family protein [Tenuifilum thalassicum]
MKKMMLTFAATFMVAALFAQGLKIGDKAPDFRLKNVDGKMISLADYKDAKGFIVIFSCNHCPFVKAYEDRIIELHKKFEPKGFPVVAINSNDPNVVPEDSYEKMIERAKEKDFPFAYLFDEGQNVYPKYGATRTPHVFILSKNKGNLVVEYIGTIDDNYKDASAVKTKYVEDAVNALLAGKKPPVTETKAIGCSIKVKK